MTLKTARLTIDRNKLPQNLTNLGVQLQRRSITTIKAGSPPKDMVIIKPAGSLLGPEEAIGPERAYHIVCGMSLKAMDGTEVQGSGQLIITGQRLIGMVDSGTAVGGAPLSVEKSGNVFCFTCRRDDVYPPQVKKHRLTPSDFTFRSKEEQPVAFNLLVMAAMVRIAAGDKMEYWQDKSMLHALSDEGRAKLLKN